MQNMQQEKPRKKQFSLSLMVRVFLALLIVVSLVVFINSVMVANEKLQEAAELEREVAGLQEEKEEYQELLNSEHDESFIIRIARKVWGLFSPDEEIFFNNRNS